MSNTPQIQNWIKQGTIPQRLLLSGFGSGWNLALELASTLQDCPLTQIQEGIQGDTLCLKDDGQSFKIGNDQNPERNTARGLVEWINQKPVSPHRIVILENIERSTDTALQALLKVLEEPPGRARFILTTQNHHRLLPTIISRVTQVTIPHNFDNFDLSVEAKDFLESPDLLLKFKIIENLRAAEKEDKTHKPILTFVDHLLLHARFFPQYQTHLESIFEARQDLGRNINPKLVLEMLAIQLTKA